MTSEMRITVIVPMLFISVALLGISIGQFARSTSAREFKVPIRGHCQVCHKPMADEWMKSGLARAWRSELFKELSDDYELEECLHCHAPARLLDKGYGKEPNLRERMRESGVDCASCHADLKGSMHGPYEIARTFHECTKNEKLGTVEMCASCHAKFGTVDEFKASKWGKDPKACVDCHMPKVERPIAEIRASGKKFPKRVSRLHTFRSIEDIQFVRDSIKLEAQVQGENLVVKLISLNVGHKFPTGYPVNAVVIDVTVRDGGKVLLHNQHVLADDREQGGNDTRLPPNGTVTMKVPLEGKKGRAIVRVLYKRPKQQPDEKARELLKVEVPVK